MNLDKLRDELNYNRITLDRAHRKHRKKAMNDDQRTLIDNWFAYKEEILCKEYDVTRMRALADEYPMDDAGKAKYYRDTAQSLEDSLPGLYEKLGPVNSALKDIIG